MTWWRCRGNPRLQSGKGRRFRGCLEALGLLYPVKLQVEEQMDADGCRCGANRALLVSREGGSRKEVQCELELSGKGMVVVAGYGRREKRGTGSLMELWTGGWREGSRQSSTRCKRVYAVDSNGYPDWLPKVSAWVMTVLTDGSRRSKVKRSGIGWKWKYGYGWTVVTGSAGSRNKARIGGLGAAVGDVNAWRMQSGRGVDWLSPCSLFSVLPDHLSAPPAQAHDFIICSHCLQRLGHP